MRTSHRINPVVTVLEDRTNPSQTFVVNLSEWNASKANTLPWAIEQANKSPGYDFISLNLPPNTTITAESTLEVTEVVSIRPLVAGPVAGQFVTITSTHGTVLDFNHAKGAVFLPTPVDGPGPIPIDTAVVDGEGKGGGPGGDPGVMMNGSELLGVTFSNCKNQPEASEDDGGAIRVTAGRLMVDSCVFVNNKGNYGGAIAVKDGATLELGRVNGPDGPAAVAGNEFHTNRALIHGGAIWSEGTVTAASPQLFKMNDGFSRGGAMYSEGVVLSAVGATVNNGVLWDFVQNTALYGGGVAIEGGTAEFSRAYFYQNIGATYGGGISIRGGDVTFTDSAFVQNSSKRGGGLDVIGGAAVDLSNTSFLGNFMIGGAANNGRAIYLNDAGTTVFTSGCTFDDNGVKLGGPPGGAWYADDPSNPSTGPLLTWFWE